MSTLSERYAHIIDRHARLFIAKEFSMKRLNRMRINADDEGRMVLSKLDFDTFWNPSSWEYYSGEVFSSMVPHRKEKLSWDWIAISTDYLEKMYTKFKYDRSRDQVISFFKDIRMPVPLRRI
jgi:hypothetical protein